MNIALITGSAGLVGSETVDFFSNKFDLVVGIDNDMRAEFFGQDASTTWNKNRLLQKIKKWKEIGILVFPNRRKGGAVLIWKLLLTKLKNTVGFYL